MKLLIDIPEEEYELVRHENKSYRTELVLMNAVAEGTPLPKGHERLISADSLIKAIEEKAKRLSNTDTINGLCGAVALIFDAPTIVEADKGSDNE